MAKRQPNGTNRAEKIRAQKEQKRKEPQKMPFGNSATRKQTKHQVPVTRRTPYRVQQINRKRRKVNVPLKTKGAELQLPAFPNMILDWRILSGALFLLSLAMIFVFSGFSTFEVSAINLEGAQRLAGETILSTVNLSGTAIISIKPEEVENRVLEDFPSLQEASVTTGLPASVTIRVVERQPILLWQQENASLWIDAEGIMFPVRGEAEVSLTVIASGDPPAEETAQEIVDDEETVNLSLLAKPTYPETTPEFVKGVLSLKDYLPENSSLQYDPQFGLGWQDPNGWLVYFGRDISEIDIKLAEYQTIIEALQAENLTPAMISLEFLHAPFYRLEQ